MERVANNISKTSYTELARGTGVNLAHISLVLRGKRTPSLPVARRLAGVLGVSLDELAEYLESQKPKLVTI